MKRSRIFLILLPLLLLAACSVEPPTATIQNVRFVSASIEAIKTELSLDIENPNGFSLHISEIRYKLLSNGDNVVEGRIQKKIDLAAKAKTKVDLPLNFSPAQVAGAGLEVFTRRHFNYRAEVVVVVNSPFGKIEVPVSKTGKLSW